MKKDLEKTKHSEKSLIEKIKTLETSRAMLLQQLQISQKSTALGNDQEF